MEALQKELFDIISQLALYKKEIGRDREQMISRVCEIIRTPSMKPFLDRGYEGSLSMLVLGARYNLLTIVKTLIEEGADINLKSPPFHETALMEGAKHGFKNVVAYLLEHGANPNAKDHIGITALMFAAKYGDPDIVQLLIDWGADPMVYTKGGETAMLMVGGLHSKKVESILNENAKRIKKGAFFVRKGEMIDLITERGVKRVIDFYDNNMDWDIGALRAPIDDVTIALADYKRAVHLEIDVMNKVLLPTEESVFTFQFKTHEWTLLEYSFNRPTIYTDTKNLSKILKCDALLFSANDVSYTLGYYVLKDGVQEKTIFWERGNDMYESMELDCVNSFAVNKNLLLPAFYAYSNGFQVMLELYDVPEDDLERVDFIVFKDRFD